HVSTTKTFNTVDMLEMSKIATGHLRKLISSLGNDKDKLSAYITPEVLKTCLSRQGDDVLDFMTKNISLKGASNDELKGVLIEAIKRDKANIVEIVLKSGYIYAHDEIRKEIHGVAMSCGSFHIRKLLESY